MKIYNKLVRDKIPEIIEKNNKNPFIYVADDIEYWQKLKEKLNEEINEFYEYENIEELADILEVINGICKFKGFDLDFIEKIRIDKKIERGGFEKKVILEKVE